MTDPSTSSSGRSGQSVALPAHAELLLAMAELRLDPERIQTVKGLVSRKDLSWPHFIDSAAAHKLLPLVGKHVYTYHLDRKSAGYGGFRHPWLFTSAYSSNRHRNQSLADEFAAVFREFLVAKIPFAIRKGFSLAEGVYLDIGTRRMNDLDLLVSRADASVAHTVLARLGYQQGTIDADAELVTEFSRQTRIFWKLNLSNQLPYRKPGGRPDVPEFNIDLCHDIFQPKTGCSVPAEEIIQRSSPAVFCGTDCVLPDWADRLLDLCSHLHKEATSLHFIGDSGDLQIGKFLDIALLSRGGTDSEWASFLKRVESYGAQEIAYYSMDFTVRLYPGSIPGHVLDDLRPSSLDYLEEYGALDGKRATWGSDFLTRLFELDRGHDSEKSVVPQG